MKAMQLTDYDQPLVLRNIPVPTAEAGQVTVKIHTCGLNFGDLLIIKGTYQERPQLPFTLGMEICGTVTEVGTGVTELQVGDRVASYNGFGGLAEYATIAADICVPVPSEMSDRDAAAFLVAYGTSHVALDYSETDDIRDIVRALGGADVVYDPVGGDQFKAALRACNPEARILPLGFASGEVPQIPANILLVKNLTVIGYYWGGYSKIKPSVLTDSFAQLIAWYQDGKLTPHISRTLPLADCNEGLDLLRTRKATGKVIIEIG